MLEHVNLRKRISKEDYREIFPKLEEELAAVERAAREAGIPVAIVFEGWDAAGKGGVINRLTQAFDPRGFKVHAISAPNEVERFYPWLWRFRTSLPADGHIAIYDRSWYGRVLIERVNGLISQREWEQAYLDIQEFERQLADSGRVIVKFWLHIGRKEQKKRFENIEKDPVLSWKVGKQEWKQQKRYDEWTVAVEDMLQRTGAAHARWNVIPSTQGRFARVRVFETILTALKEELDRRKTAPPAVRESMPEPVEGPSDGQTVLDELDLTLSLDRATYAKRLDELQERLFRLEHELYIARVPAVIVYEGSDAGGKGGNIRRLTRGLDPRGYEVIPVAAPNDEERGHHYLWRFWRHVPKAGHITIFDRSWYGRVLVERVEGFCTEAEWRRAYREINEFERKLTDFGTVMVKFWLHIDRDEQLRRFKAREETPAKQWKITDEDWRNREKWKQYKVSVVEMLQRTSTTYAPWTILEANCKLHARIKALETVARALEAGLEKAR